MMHGLEGIRGGCGDGVGGHRLIAALAAALKAGDRPAVARLARGAAELGIFIDLEAGSVPGGPGLSPPMTGGPIR